MKKLTIFVMAMIFVIGTMSQVWSQAKKIETGTGIVKETVKPLPKDVLKTDLVCAIFAYWDEARTKPIQDHEVISGNPTNIWFYIAVENKGPTKAENFQLKVVITRLAGTSPLGSPEETIYNVVKIDPHKGLLYHRQVMLPAGAYNVRAIAVADPTHKVNESNEENNQRTFTLAVHITSTQSGDATFTIPGQLR